MAPDKGIKGKVGEMDVVYYRQKPRFFGFKCFNIRSSQCFCCWYQQIMQNGQLWPSIWHHLRHPLVAELRRWGWRNSSTPLDTLSNNEGYPNHWFTRPHDWILCSPKDWYERVPWISTTSSTGAEICIHWDVKSRQTSNWPCSACLVAHVDIDWIPGYALISFSSSLPTLCPVQLSFTELIGLIFFAICGCFFIRKPNGGFSYHPIFVSVF